MNPRDFRQAGAALAQNLNTYIENHPDSFEILLFKSILATPETVAVGSDVVGSVEVNERSLEYADPIPARALFVPDNMVFGMADEGDEQSGAMDQSRVLLINQDEVPRQSVVQFEEFIGETETRLVNLYVISSESIGTAPGGGEKHYCIPFQAFNDTVGNKP